MDIEVGHPPYLVLADMLHGWAGRTWWEDLGNLLGGRPGWRCQLVNQGELLWSYGAMGRSPNPSECL